MKFLDWLERFLIALASFNAGKKVGSRERSGLEDELEKSKLQTKILESQNAVNAKYYGKSDSDIIDMHLTQQSDKVSKPE